MNPKTSFYLHNGSGRDTYIGWNSGGLRHEAHPLKMCFSSKIRRKNDDMAFKIGSPHMQNTKITHAGVKYFGDGTGRDSYVITNDGGTTRLISSHMYKKFF